MGRRLLPGRRHGPPYPTPYREFLARFNRADYRACVDPLEVLYFQRGRSAFYQGLIQLVVALLQLRLGMVRSPRVLLTSARGRLGPYAPRYRGLDVAAVLTLIEQTLARLPADTVSLSPAEIAALDLPTLRLKLRGSRARRHTRTRTRERELTTRGLARR